MATPVGFEGSNGIAEGFDDVRDLQIFAVPGPPPQIISAWRLSPEEIARINETGVVWLSVYSTAIPPFAVSGTELVHIDGRPSRAEPILPWKSMKDRKK